MFVCLDSVICELGLFIGCFGLFMCMVFGKWCLDREFNYGDSSLTLNRAISNQPKCMSLK